MKQSFSKTKIIPLREAFSADGTVVGKEATDFTPWFCKDDNLNHYLGEALGMTLEEPKKESKVGFALSLDILCINTKDKSRVAIENQFGKSDHKHLGQLLTYGAGLKTPTMVWIAEDFTEEHLVALKWLNNNTNPKISFFGVKVEARKIGDSPIAIDFAVVCHPKDWRKPKYGKKQKASKEKKSRVQDNGLLYWQEFQKYLKSKKSKLYHINPCDRPWQRLTIRVNRVQIDARINTSKTKISVELNLEHRTLAKTYFKHLEKDRKAIEKEIGADVKLEWRNDAKNLGATIIQVKEVDPKDWKKQHAWLKERMETFEKVFKERMQDIAEEVKNN